MPEESKLEEVYHFRVRPQQGFGLQRVYGNGFDRTYAVGDGDVATISEGYHSVAAAPGYDLYYLWMLAGEHRVMHMREDPQHRWVQAQPEVYYFSWATEATFRDPLDGTEVPEIGMPGALASISRFMGRFSRRTAEGPVIVRSWWKNDGIVNTNSMDGPTLGSGDAILPYDGRPVPGRWQYMGLLESVDHLDVIGIPLASRSLESWYVSMAALLASLQ